MKKILFSLLAATAAFTACNNKPATEKSEETAAQVVVSSDIAYVKVEEVLSQCDLYLKEGAPLREKTEKTQKSWAKKEQNLQYEAAQLQEKYQKGLITTLNAQAEQQKIEQKAQNYQANAQREAKTLDEENFVFTNRAQDLVQRAVQKVNADKKYRLIVNANALIDADSTLDITKTVLETVNQLYAAEKKEAAK